jgi:hypothetical protein
MTLSKELDWAIAGLLPNGKLLAVFRGEVLDLYDTTTAEKSQSLPAGGTGHKALTFSADGKLLATASNDTTVLLWDATRFQPRRRVAEKMRPEQLKTLWDDLASDDARKAYRAIQTLTAAPKESVEFLKGQLRPVVPADAQQVARLVSDLDSEQFATREKALQELEKLGDRAAGALHKVLAGKPSLEVQRRIEQLLAKQPGVDYLRAVRALEALEQMGTPEARKLCALLADGAAEARLTREAQATLQHLAGRSAAPSEPRP